MSTAVRALLLAALLTLVPVAVGVSVADDPTTAPTPPPSYVATPLSEFDSTAAVVRRAPFCTVVPAAAAKQALGVPAVATAYGNGQTLPSLRSLPRGDVAHEYGCVISPAERGAPVEARAWVFVPPVTAARARSLAAAARAERGCEPAAGAAAFGSPTVALLCTVGTTRTASYRGLFGDAWFSCSLTLPVSVPPADLLDRAGTWCVAAARAAERPSS